MREKNLEYIEQDLKKSEDVLTLTMNMLGITEHVRENTKRIAESRMKHTRNV